MRHGELNRDGATAIAGKEIVDSLDNVDCDYTNRLQTDGDTSVEFSASISFYDNEFDCHCRLVAYYYQDEKDLDDCSELDTLDWGIHGYEVY